MQITLQYIIIEFNLNIRYPCNFICKTTKQQIRLVFFRIFYKSLLKINYLVPNLLNNFS